MKCSERDQTWFTFKKYHPGCGIQNELNKAEGKAEDAVDLGGRDKVGDSVQFVECTNELRKRGIKEDKWVLSLSSSVGGSAIYWEGRMGGRSY